MQGGYKHGGFSHDLGNIQQIEPSHFQLTDTPAKNVQQQQQSTNLH